VFSCDVNESTSHLYIGKLDGTRRQITSTGESNFAPSWSPDGRSIVFLRDAGTRFQLFIHDVASGTERLVGSVSNATDQVRWSPDGRRIAYARSAANGQRSVWVADLDGTPGKQIGGEQLSDPTWSPDGTRLIVTQILANGPQRLAMYNLEGGRPVVVTTPASGQLDRHADAHR
jgi:TolB protein